MKNIFSFLLSLISLVFMFTYPLEPSQISLISMFTIGVPAFFLALEPNKNIIKGHFLTNVFLKALPAAVTDALAVGALVVFGRTFGVDSTDISTAATMLLAIVGFMILYKISAPMNKIRVGILAGCIAGTSVLQHLPERSVRDHGHDHGMCDAVCCVCHRHGAGTAVSDRAGGEDEVLLSETPGKKYRGVRLDNDNGRAQKAL